MLDQAIRYGAILAQPEFGENGRILEVGSGSRGLTVFIRDPVIGVDVGFREKPDALIMAIRAPATALPLRDKCLEQVVCSDVLEHMGKEDRPKAIEEMIRVTKGTFFLACPCGRGAHRIDRWLLRAYRVLSIKPPDWLEEHLRMGIPEPEDIRDVLKSQTLSWREEKGESTFVHAKVSLLISARFLNNLWSSIIRNRADLAGRIARWAKFPGVSPYRRLWIVWRSPK